MPYRISNQTLLGAALLGTLALAGCGGSSSPTPTTPIAIAISTITGSVIDGYIEGATVCLDVNVNQVCDASEPSTSTAANGSYKLDTSALSAVQIRAAHLLTVVPLTAKDSDDSGQTLAQAGKKGFSFMAPAEAYVAPGGGAVTGAVISPLTTLVSHDMIAGGNVLATANSNVRSRLGLVETIDLTQDFVAKKDTALIEKAQMLTVAIGEVKAQAKTGQTTDKQAFFAALDYLQNQVAVLTREFQAAKASNANAKPVDLVKTAMTTEAAKPAVADLVAQAKRTEIPIASASALVAFFEQGFYGGDNLLDDCARLAPNLAGSCMPAYFKVLGSAGKIILEHDFNLSGNNWIKDDSRFDNELVLTSAGWKVEDSCTANESTSYSTGSDGVTTVKFCAGTSERLTARILDAGGKTLSTLGLNPPENFAGTTMPPGSQLAWFTFVNNEDHYTLFKDFTPTRSSTSPNLHFTSLDNFITAHTQTGNTPSGQFIFRSDNLAFSFAPNGGLTLFDNFSANLRSTGTSTYTRKTVNGEEVLIINAKSPNKGPLIIFSVFDNKVTGGEFRSKTVKPEETAVANKIMINALLAAGGWPPVLD